MKSIFINLKIYAIVRLLIIANVIHSSYLLFAQYPDNIEMMCKEIVFEQIFLEQGLSQSIVQCILQDKEGFMWFGTEDGLNRYDGYHFTVIKHDPKNANSLSYNNITSICEDSKGIIWIGTFHGGLNKYDPYKGQFTRFQNDPLDETSLSHDNINAIYEDKSGTLWIGTDDGLNRVIPAHKEGLTDKFLCFRNDPDNPNSLSHNTIQSIYQDSRGVIWIGSDGGLNALQWSEQNDSNITVTAYRNERDDPHSLSNDVVRSIYEDHSGVLWIGTNGGLNRLVDARQADSQIKFKRYLYNEYNGNSLSHNEVYTILEDRSGVLWIGTNGGGLNVFDRINQRFISLRHDPEDPNTLSYNEVRDIYEDRSGLLWIGTYGGGIDKINRNKKKFKRYSRNLRDPNSLSEDIVWCIYEDKAGILWIGTHGGGLNRYDRKSNKWKHFRHIPDDPSSLSHNIVRVVYEDHSGRFWIGTHGGGVNLFDPATEKFRTYKNEPDNFNSISHDQIRTIYQDRSGVVWIGTYGGGLNKLQSGSSDNSAPTFLHYRHAPFDSNSISHDIVRVVFEDKFGGFWIGTEGGGLNKLDRETGKFKHYRSNPDDPRSLSNDYIFSIHEDRFGMLWISTWGGGLNKFDRNSETFRYYTEADGMPDDAIYGMLEDDQGNLWLSTNNGLCRFDPKLESFRNYDRDDGLQSNEFNGGSFFKSASGEMFFGGISGFNSFYPSEIKDNPYIAPIVITSFSKLNQEVKFDKPISALDEIRLSHKDYFFSIEFAALDYTIPVKNRYAYKMEGLDDEWIITGTKKRFATYTTLAPGSYLFRVMGSNNDGIWNEDGVSLRIIINPAFWQTWWFQTLMILVFITIAIELYRRRMKNIKMKTELQAAHDAQMSIMPAAGPKIEGIDIASICLPANEVGGDFFDYFWTNEKSPRFGIAIGDVSGKAMKAAMIAVLTDGMISSTVRNLSSTAAMMTQLNQPIYSKIEKNMFTALLLALIDVENKELAFTNAGLNEPLLKSAKTVQNLKSEGATHPLGMMEDLNYSEKKVSLHSGDTLVLITDGVVEALNHKRECYGEERLSRLMQQMDTVNLGAEEIKYKIIDDIKNFSSGAQQYDDMALIVVKFN
jgi:serine phosphatase RsbU (regulator of sigma subunit)/ligand-binding sensor domain-containing protein